MKSKILILGLLLSSLVFPSVVFAQDAGQTIDLFFEKSGISHSAMTLAGQISAGLDQQRQTRRCPRSLTPAQTEPIVQSVFAGESVISDLKDHFIQNYNETHIQHLLEWYNTDFGSKVTALENEATTPTMQQDIIKYVSTLQSTPPSDERLALLDEIDQTLNLSKFASEINLASFDAMTEVIVANAKPEERSQMETQLPAIRSQVERGLAQNMPDQIILTLLYTYRNLSDDELRQYTDFLSSPESQWFNKEYTTKFPNILKDRTQEMTKQLIELIQQEREGTI